MQIHELDIFNKSGKLIKRSGLIITRIMEFNRKSRCQQLKIRYYICETQNIYTFPCTMEFVFHFFFVFCFDWSFSFKKKDHKHRHNIRSGSKVYGDFCVRNNCLYDKIRNGIRSLPMSFNYAIDLRTTIICKRQHKPIEWKWYSTK